MNMTAAMETRTNKPLTACTDQEIYLALLDIVREQSAARVRPVTGRKLYYISAEFLIGKLLSNNLINLGLYDDPRAALAAEKPCNAVGLTQRRAAARPPVVGRQRA